MMLDGKLLKGETFERTFEKVPLFIAVDYLYTCFNLFIYFHLLVDFEDTYTLTLHNTITRLAYFM